MTYNMNLEENVYEKPFQHYELNDPKRMQRHAAMRMRFMMLHWQASI